MGQTNSLLILYVFAFLINLGWGMVIPLFPLILERAGGDLFSFTFSFFLFNILSALLRFPLGYIADVKRRKNLLLFSALAGFLSSFLAYFYTLPLLFIAFGLLGVSSAFYYQTLYALVVDKVGRNKIGRAYGNTHIAEGIGYILGPLISGFLLEIQPLLIFLLTFLIFLSSLLPIIWLEEPVQKRDYASFLPSLQLVFYTGAFLFASEVLRGFTAGLISPSLPVYLENDFFATPSTVGILTTIMEVSMFSAQMTGKVVDRFGSIKLFIISSIIASPFLLCFSFADSLLLISLLSIFFYFFSGMAWLSFSSLLAVNAPEERRALFLGSAWSMWRFGFAFGSISCGFIWKTFSIRSLFPISASLTLFSTLFVILFLRHRGNC